MSSKRKHKTLKSGGKRRYVYFIASETGDIKIGIAYDPEERIRNLQTGSSETLQLLGYIPGGAKLEAELHKRFARYRVYHGEVASEWFRPGPELLEYLRSEGILPNPILSLMELALSYLNVLPHYERTEVAYG